MKIWDDTKQYANNIYDDLKGLFDDVVHPEHSNTTVSTEITPMTSLVASEEQEAMSTEQSTTEEYEQFVESTSSILTSLIPEETSIITSSEAETSLFSTTATPTSVSITATPSESQLLSSTQNTTNVESKESPHHHSGLVIFFVTVLIIFAAIVVAPYIVNFFLFLFNIGRLFVYGSSFNSDSEIGLESDTFNLSENINSDDRRSGLSRGPKLQILWYMFFHRENFDEARYRYVRRQFAKYGIAPDGVPIDPKTVSYEI